MSMSAFLNHPSSKIIFIATMVFMWVTAFAGTTYNAITTTFLNFPFLVAVVFIHIGFSLYTLKYLSYIVVKAKLSDSIFIAEKWKQDTFMIRYNRPVKTNLPKYVRSKVAPSVPVSKYRYHTVMKWLSHKHQTPNPMPTTMYIILTALYIIFSMLAYIGTHDGNIFINLFTLLMTIVGMVNFVCVFGFLLYPPRPYKDYATTIPYSNLIYVECKYIPLLPSLTPPLPK